MKDEPKESRFFDCIFWAVIIGGAIALIIWTSDSSGPRGRSDDPFDDAPIGRTYGGDTY